MIILGIDPGLATVGYGIIDCNKNSVRALDYGVISTPKTEGLPIRLAMIGKDICTLLEKYKPDEVAIEELFFNKNVTNALMVAHARGVVIYETIQRVGRVFEYTPLQIKQAVTGYGRADKSQIQNVVKTVLQLQVLPKPDDAADALAVAICHSQTKNLSQLFFI